MNKKGFLPILIIGVVLTLVIVIILFNIIEAIQKNILLILSIIIIFGGVITAMIYQNKMKNILIISISLGILLITFHYLGLTQETTLFSDYYIEVPFFGTIQCDQAEDGAIISGKVTIPKEGKTYSCPVNTKQCDILIDFEKLGGFITTARFIDYTICDNLNRCNNYRTDDIRNGLNNYVLTSNLPKSSTIKIWFTKNDFFGKHISISETGYVKFRYIPYVLWRKDSLQGGFNQIPGSTDCKLPVATSGGIWGSAIISSTIKDITGKSAITLTKNYLNPSEPYNYISGTITRASLGNTLTYKNKPGYCIENIQGENKAIIYAIGEIKTNDFIYKIVDTNTELGREECCNVGEVILNKICNSNYVFEDIIVNPSTGETNVECSLTQPCNIGRFTLDKDKQTSFRYICNENNKCVISDIQTEECVETSQCGENEVCINFKCTEASTIPDQIKEGAIKDSNNGNESSCQFYETYVESEKVVKKWYNYIGIGKPDKVAYNRCVTQGWVYAAIGALTLIIIVILIIILNKPRKKIKKK